MTVVPRSTALTALFGIALASSLALTGCSLLPHFPSPPSVGNPADSASDGSTDGWSDGSTPGGDDDLRDNPLLDHQVPDTFPTADVPLPNLEILAAIDLGTGWSIIYSSADPVADFTAEADALTAAGFNTIAKTTDGAGSFGAFENGTYQAQVTGADADHSGYDGAALSIVVVKLS